jgi:hypothetical protein
MSEDYAKGMDKAHLIYLKDNDTASIILRGTNQQATAVVQYTK